MQDKLIESLDSEFLERENPDKNLEKVLLTINWIGLILIGLVFKILYQPFSIALLFIGCTSILVVGILRFYRSTYKTPAVVVPLMVYLCAVLWVFSTVYSIPIRNELKYITFGAILMKAYFLEIPQTKIDGEKTPK